MTGCGRRAAAAPGGPEGRMRRKPRHSHTQPILWLGQLEPLRFLGSPGLWTGLVAAAVLLAAAARLRRRREPI